MPNTREKQLVAYDPIAFGEFTGSIKNTCEAYNTYDDGYMDGVERVEDWLEVNCIANGVTVNEWISVKDRLPESECLAVSMLTGPAYKEMLIGYVGEASNWDTGYECESDGEILPNVTHWMPLPQPPKGE